MEGLGVNPEFWYGKRVFITGHTGFKGSWLSLWLQSLGAELTGYALKPPTDPSLFGIARVGQGMTSLEGDIRDLEKLSGAMKQAAPEIVIHMAAQPLVRASYVEPVETYSTNVMGTVNLLDAVRKCSSVRGVVNVTTDKCYENREWVWPYRENEPMGGYDPYSSSKGCSELVTSAYRASFFNPQDYSKHGVAVATARAGNVIGGGDWAEDRLVPDCLGAFTRSKAVHIRNPRSTRPWQHVLEPLRGYLALVEKLIENGRDFAEAWNFGPNLKDAQPVNWVVVELAKRWGADASWLIDGSDHPHEANYLKLDISKARERLNWEPILNLEHALDLTVEWHSQYRAGRNIRAVTLSQINEYQKQLT
jgi:CDP-glucose 4,6-dehydratase